VRANVTPVGTHVELANEMEGWFQGIDTPVVRGIVEAELPTTGLAAPWLLVRLDTALQLQVHSTETISRLRCVRCELVWIRPRHVGSVLTAHDARSVFVCVVPEGRPPADHLRSITAPNFWAACRLVS